MYNCLSDWSDTMIRDFTVRLLTNGGTVNAKKTIKNCKPLNLPIVLFSDRSIQNEILAVTLSGAY